MEDLKIDQRRVNCWYKRQPSASNLQRYPSSSFLSSSPSSSLSSPSNTSDPDSRNTSSSSAMIGQSSWQITQASDPNVSSIQSILEWPEIIYSNGQQLAENRYRDGQDWNKKGHIQNFTNRGYSNGQLERQQYSGISGFNKSHLLNF